MRHFVIHTIFSYWSLTSALSAQVPVDSFRLLFTIPGETAFATADNLGNIYRISDRNRIEKYTPEGQLVAQYTNNRLGKATSLDVSNPLKILVWYGDFRTVLMLNRSLTVLGELNLIAAGFPEIRTVATAADGNLWIYDEVDFQLRKITPAGEKLLESQALNLLLPERLSPVCIRDNGSEVLASDPQAGMLAFDVYAQYQRLFPWKNVESFVLGNHHLVYLHADALHIEHLRTFNSYTRPLPDSVKSSAGLQWLGPGRLLVQNNKSLEVWQFPEKVKD